MNADSVNIAPLTSTVRIVSGQLGLSLSLAAVVWVLWGHTAGLSALVGTLICVLPNAYLGLRLALTDVRSGAKSLVRSAYLGELIKLSLTVVLFIVAFVFFKGLEPGFLLLGFIASQLALWGAIFWASKT
ncbi:MAG: ATP synthase subunit I [Pseudomonadota bacterium]